MSQLFKSFCFFFFKLKQILNASAQGDVDGLSQNAAFGAGVNSGSCTFVILNDLTPEANETFAVELLSPDLSQTVVSPSVAYLTILANDDAFGIIGFNEVHVRQICWQ